MPGLRSISTLLLLFALGHAHYGQAEVVIDWKEEIDLLGKELVDRHPNLFFETGSSLFQRSMDRVAEESEGKSVFEISVELQQVLANMGDDHTSVNYHYNIDSQLILPLECYWFEDGLYILRSIRDYAGLVGKKIVAINEFPVQQVIDSLSTLITARNPSLVKNDIPRMLTWTQLLHHFGFSEIGHLKLSVEAEGGEVDFFHIELPAGDSDALTVKPDSIPLGWQDTRTFFRDLYLSEERIYYIQYNKCWSREAEKMFGSGGDALFMPSFDEFEKKVLRVARGREIHKLVLDLRYNSGGSSLQGYRLIRKLEKTGIGKKAIVYLVVGRRTTSSAVINAVDLIKAFNVVIIGEDSGGKPNHYGEVKRFVLPQSNLVVNYSTKYFTLLEDDPRAIIPDIYTPDTFAGYMEGIDPAFEAIRKHSPR